MQKKKEKEKLKKLKKLKDQLNVERVKKINEKTPKDKEKDKEKNTDAIKKIRKKRHVKELEHDMREQVSGKIYKVQGGNVDYDEINKMAKNNIRDVDEAARESLSNDGLERAIEVMEKYIKTGEASLRDIKELEKECGKDTIAQAYVKTAENASRQDLKWLMKIDDTLDFSHPGYERCFDKMREQDKNTDKILDWLDNELGRERE